MWLKSSPFLLLLFAFICTVFAATEASTDPPEGYKYSLNIHQDAIMDKSERDHKSKQIVYSSIVEYDFDVKEFADEEILGLAEQAHKEMFIIHKDWHNKCYGAKKNMKKWQPTVMTVIAVGKKVFFASSLKLSEPNIMINKENAITEALSQCRMSWLDNPDAGSDDPRTLHRTGAHCGEIMATALALNHEGKYPWDLGDARIVAWGSTAKGGALFDPCGADAEKSKAMGCHQFVEWTKMKPLTEAMKLTPKPVERKPKEYHETDLDGAWEVKPYFAADASPLLEGAAVKAD